MAVSVSCKHSRLLIELKKRERKKITFSGLNGAMFINKITRIALLTLSSLVDKNNLIYSSCSILS